MMMTPATRASSDLYCARTWPTSVEIAPSVMNTMLKPRMKARELSINLRSRCPSVDFSSSMPAPEIRETYPGTSGSTQGERNEIRPATKAASGNGKLVIKVLIVTGALFSGGSEFLVHPYKDANPPDLTQSSGLRSQEDRLFNVPLGFWLVLLSA